MLLVLELLLFFVYSMRANIIMIIKINKWGGVKDVKYVNNIHSMRFKNI